MRIKCINDRVSVYGISMSGDYDGAEIYDTGLIVVHKGDQEEYISGYKSVHVEANYIHNVIRVKY